MTPNQKGLIAVGLTLGVVGLVYYLSVSKNSKSGKSDSENLEALKKNLGGKYLKDSATVGFNLQKNMATFYSNNRVAIFDENKKLLSKGTYSDGGKKIVMDNGKTAESGSVWENLLTLIKY